MLTTLVPLETPLKSSRFNLVKPILVGSKGPDTVRQVDLLFSITDLVSIIKRTQTTGPRTINSTISNPLVYWIKRDCSRSNLENRIIGRVKS